MEFSGTFRDGKLHGKGKEYIGFGGSGEDYIEGVFKNGEICGKAKEFKMES